MRKIILALLLFSLPLAFAIQLSGDRYYTLSGKSLNLPKPAEFRLWEFVGSSVVPNDKNNNKAIFPGVHNVYIDPISYRHRQEKGTFRDGTIIVMEVLHMATREAESGYGYFSTGGQDILAAVKDRRVFPGSGWAYFVFQDKELKAGKSTASHTEDARCQTCHQAAAEDDEVFVQYYPALKRKR